MQQFSNRTKTSITFPRIWDVSNILGILRTLRNYLSKCTATLSQSVVPPDLRLPVPFHGKLARIPIKTNLCLHSMEDHKQIKFPSLQLAESTEITETTNCHVQTMQTWNVKLIKVVLREPSDKSSIHNCMYVQQFKQSSKRTFTLQRIQITKSN